MKAIEEGIPPIISLFSSGRSSCKLSNRRDCDSDKRTMDEISTNRDELALNSVIGKIRKRIGELVQEEPSSIFLTVSGMATIYTALRLSLKIMNNKRDEQKNNISLENDKKELKSIEEKKKKKWPCVVFGFPYLDTLKVIFKSVVTTNFK